MIWKSFTWLMLGGFYLCLIDQLQAQALAPVPAQESSSPVLVAIEEQVNSSIPLVLADDRSQNTGLIQPEELDWWTDQARQSLKPSSIQVPIDIHSILIDTLRYSARVRALSDNVVIAETAITQTAADFDPTTFLESKLVRTSVPTGSTLDAGFSIPRLREEDWYTRGGIRRKTTRGGRLELSQRMGLKDSNSTFFTPDNQGNSRLSLSYNHPFLRGSGNAYNTNLIVLAKLDSQVAVDRSQSELQDQLLEVVEAMWDLYLQRTLLVQKQAHIRRAEIIQEWLDSRQGLDALASQVARARAAVAVRKTQLIRTGAMVGNAESKLRSLVNWPDAEASRQWELIPVDSPLIDEIPIDVNNALVTALQNRQEVNIASREIEGARVRLNVAKNELLPVLDGVLESYVSGLRGNFGMGRAWVDQFSTGEPAYSAGVLMEVPWGRRAANANHQRRKAELRQLASKFEATVATLNAEVEIAVREVSATFLELQAKKELVVAARADTAYLQRRWENLPGDERSASFLLEDLLDSQDRLAAAEASYSQAPIDYTLSLIRLNRAIGTLLQTESVELIRGSDNGVPTVQFEKMPDQSMTQPSIEPSTIQPSSSIPPIESPPSPTANLTVDNGLEPTAPVPTPPNTDVRSLPPVLENPLRRQDGPLPEVR